MCHSEYKRNQLLASESSQEYIGHFWFSKWVGLDSMLKCDKLGYLPVGSVEGKHSKWLTKKRNKISWITCSQYIVSFKWEIIGYIFPRLHY